MSTFAELLNRQASTVEAPKPVPVGTYLAIIDGQPEFSKWGRKNTDCVIFRIKLIQAGNDVSQGDLQEALRSSDGTYKALSDVKINHRMGVTDDSLHFLQEFLVRDLGIDPIGKTMSQIISEAMGKQLLVNLGHQTSEDGSRVFVNVKNTLKV